MSADAELADLLADWIAIWRSEATALALDPEWREAGDRIAALWAALAGSAGDGLVARPAGSGPTPGAAAAGAPPGAGSELESRVAELERQLAELRRNLREPNLRER